MAWNSISFGCAPLQHLHGVRGRNLGTRAPLRAELTAVEVERRAEDREAELAARRQELAREEQAFREGRVPNATKSFAETLPMAERVVTQSARAHSHLSGTQQQLLNFGCSQFWLYSVPVLAVPVY